MKTLSATILCLLLLTACHHKDEEKHATTERAVLVYIAADNTLTSYTHGDPTGHTLGDIPEMMEGSRRLSKGDKLLLFVDKRGQKPYLLEVSKGDTTRLLTYDEELKSSDAATLQMAMQQLVKRYPCDSYGLVLWGHADGWIYKDEASARQGGDDRASRPKKAYGVDMTGGETWMNIPEMAEALSVLPKLDFIFADCCAFQSVESAYELRQVTDYIIASPAEIPGEGAPYETVIPALFNKGETFYELAVDAYYAQSLDGIREPLSVIKTSEMENLAEATRQALLSFVPQQDSRYPNTAGLIYYFDYTLFDMNDFMLRHASSQEYETWRRAFDEAVVYKTFTPEWIANHVLSDVFPIAEERYGGVNMFVPQDVTYFSPYYQTNIDRQNRNIRRMQWYTAAGLADLGW